MVSRIALHVLGTLGIAVLVAVPGDGFPQSRSERADEKDIDVAFEVTKFGESRRIEIVEAAPNVSDAAKRELVTLIKDSRFRQRITDGELGRASPVLVRYSFDD